MFSYNVNWSNFVEGNTPQKKRQFYRMHWLKFLVSEVQKLHTKFQSFKDSSHYMTSHNGQRIYLEKVLNDNFDPSNQEIYIEDIVPDRMYLYLKSEGQTNYLYSKYQAANAYAVGEYAIYNNKLWVCTAASTGNTPADPSSFWDLIGDTFFLFSSAEYITVGFIVFVPVSLVYDSAEMNAWIKRYKLAGMPYTIQTYTP